MEKLPPIEKIYEAYSAIADGRVRMEETSAGVTSSDGAKKYTVTWEGDIYSSNDNASYWQGYAGYPILAVLMLQGRLPLDGETATQFGGIDWKRLNTKYNNKYDRAVREILDGLKSEGADTDGIVGEVQRVYAAIRALDIRTRRSALKPPHS